MEGFWLDAMIVLDWFVLLLALLLSNLDFNYTCSEFILLECMYSETLLPSSYWEWNLS